MHENPEVDDTVKSSVMKNNTPLVKYYIMREKYGYKLFGSKD